MTRFEPDKKSALTELEILRDELYQKERPVIRELLGRLQRADAPEEFMDLQFKLIGRAKARQHMASELREEQERLKAELSELVKLQPKPIEQIKELQRQLKLREHQRRVSEALRWIAISIGDAMAWKVLGYDRAAITILGQGDRVARFADEDGFDAEVTAIEQEWQQGRLAIHNDLTTCLRHGDITVIDPEERSVQIGEVKRTKELGPGDPQMKRMADATTLINEGRLEREGEAPLNVHRIELPYRTFLSNLREVVVKARQDGHVASKAGSCQHIEVFRFDAGLSDAELMARRRKAREATGWFDGTTATFEWVWTIRRMRDRRYSFSGLAPLSILPLDPEDLTDLVMGYVDVAVVLNADCLARKFEAKGLTVEIAVPPEHGEVFLRARKRLGDWEITVQLGPQLREQMLNELMTPASVIGAVEHLIQILAGRERDGDRRQEAHVVALADERRVWTS